MNDRKTSVAVEGDFFGAGPISIVNRGWSGALARTGRYDLSLLTEANAGTIPGPQGALLEPLRRRRPGDGGPQVTIRHAWPPATAYVRRGATVHVQPWEYGALPIPWAQAWRDSVDEIWCYSRHVANTYLAAGFAPERVHVVPLGFDPEIFAVDGPRRVLPPVRCRFLFVGRTIRRKGIQMAIEAYFRAFRSRDDVELVVKDFEPPGVAPMETARAGIEGVAGRSDLARLRYLNEEFADEAAVAALYRSATCLVLPYQAEGFGLTVLEAMACGVPAIVTRGGATDDFVAPEEAYPIEATRLATGSAGLCGEGWVLQPNVLQIADAMRAVYTNVAEARARGARAAARAAAGWTWDRAAERAAARIDALAAGVPRNPAPQLRKTFDGFPAIGIFEEKVCSQNGEDGVIAELFRKLSVKDPFFVEIGVEEGSECNTARLARDFGWNGVMIEADPARFPALSVRYAKQLGVKTMQAFVTRENVLQVFEAAGVPFDFDLLSIDIDGNDYWVWERIGERYRPRVAIVEINPAHPPPELWVMEYDPAFVWKHTNYYGASLQSLAELGKRLGYSLVAMESRAVNAFFVRSDLLEAVGFPELDPVAAFRAPTYAYPAGEGPSVEV